MARKTLVSKYVKLPLITETFDTPRIVMNLDVQKDYVVHIFTMFLSCKLCIYAVLLYRYF